MFLNQLKIFLRTLLKKDSLFSFINLTGLSIGSAVVILILMYSRHEWSFDTHHKNSDRIFRVWVKEHFKGEVIFNSTTPLIVGPELKNNFPEIEESVRYLTANNQVKVEDFKDQETIHFVDPSFLEVFDFPLFDGDNKQVFSNLHQAVITETIAFKYFSDSSPIGQTISIQDDGKWTEFAISGIIKQPPDNSSIQFDILVPIDNALNLISEAGQNCWTCVFGETYLLLEKDVEVSEMMKQIAPLIDEKVKDQYRPGEYIVGLQPLKDIHLNNDIPAGIVPVSDGRYPLILVSIAMLILLLACINFTSLSIGRSIQRAKEVAIRKVAGANQWQLRLVFWSEAFIMAALALGVGTLLVKILLPFFNQIADKDLTLQFDFSTILYLLLLALIIGFLSGFYPAIVLSRFTPMQSIRGIFSKIGNDRHLLLRMLVGFQFVLSIFLISCTFVMKKQLNFLQNKNLGFDQDRTVVVPYSGTGEGFFQTWEGGIQIHDRLKSELLSPSIKNVLLSNHTLGTSGWTQLGYTDEETNLFRQFYVQQIDYDYLPAMDISLTDGRLFSREVGTDKKAAIVNKAFVRQWQMNEPLGSELPGPFREFQIIGVTDNFHFTSLHSTIEPLVMVVDFLPLIRVTPDLNYIDSPNPKFSFRLAGSNLTATLNRIEDVFNEIVPEQSFTYTFMDENIDKQYRSEKRLSQIVSYSTVLAILIACLGLFGIATLSVTQRTKEIGVRKLLGANVVSLVLRLNQNFTIMVLLACVISGPLAWLFMREWLTDFAFRTPLNGWIFVGAGLVALIVAWLTVSYHSIKAALANPVNSIRNE